MLSRAICYTGFTENMAIDVGKKNTKSVLKEMYFNECRYK